VEFHCNIMKLDCALDQAGVVTVLSPVKPGFNHRLGHVGFAVG